MRVTLRIFDAGCNLLEKGLRDENTRRVRVSNPATVHQKAKKKKEGRGRGRVARLDVNEKKKTKRRGKEDGGSRGRWDTGEGEKKQPGHV